jgi:hypothetical protein
MLLTFARDVDKNSSQTGAHPLTTADVATLFSLAMPYASAPRGRIGFRVQNETKSDTAIVDAS